MKKKVLLMGKSGAGKTSMRSIIFANYVARDTRRLGATIDVEHAHVKLLGNLSLNLWDCGGQESFMQCYFASQRENIFKNVEVLIYVFDVESREVEKDLQYYKSCLDAMNQHSPKAKVFCLVHKMDLIRDKMESGPETSTVGEFASDEHPPEDPRQRIFHERESELIQMSEPFNIKCFATSIWDESLYKAWASMVYMLIPNVVELEKKLSCLADALDGHEVLLFEKATLLVIAHARRSENVTDSRAKHQHYDTLTRSGVEHDGHRFERISNMFKQCRLTCLKMATQFKFFEIRHRQFMFCIDQFTTNTYICVVLRDPWTSTAVVRSNLASVRPVFEALERHAPS